MTDQKILLLNHQDDKDVVTSISNNFSSKRTDRYLMQVQTAKYQLVSFTGSSLQE